MHSTELNLMDLESSECLNGLISLPREEPAHLPRLERESINSEKKRCDKNKFINKIRQLHDGTNSEIQTFPHTHALSALSERPSSRRERNKYAAQKSRDRISLYIQLMESNILQLEAEHQSVSEDIERVREDIFTAEMNKRTQVELT